MTIRTYKQFEYKNCPVIIRQIGKWSFEYLLLYKNKFYGTFIDDKLKWWQLYKLFKKIPYNKTEIKSMIHFVTKAAETTIETLIEKDENINKEK